MNLSTFYPEDGAGDRPRKKQRVVRLETVAVSITFRGLFALDIQAVPYESMQIFITRHWGYIPTLQVIARTTLSTAIVNRT